ncbi:hypothetical protein [Hansschlegelia zhihuaiae]|uniref:Uncharacterized protein n=1 Tax=Hansschlegelia zhihuaiae TaxID=405005 RepID=A0A4Q0MI06_9HYPH|nr:hypothetical protein [Hansschlegelia zhihuaiae]RXF72943.1 hypothetical protein EK403_12415 [Hansschlegelia zhihuaiae]
MTLFNIEVFDALLDAGISEDKAKAVAVALTPQPPGSSHQPIIGDFAVYDSLRAAGVSDEKARACAISCPTAQGR